MYFATLKYKHSNTPKDTQELYNLIIESEEDLIDYQAISCGLTKGEMFKAWMAMKRNVAQGSYYNSHVGSYGGTEAIAALTVGTIILQTPEDEDVNITQTEYADRFTTLFNDRYHNMLKTLRLGYLLRISHTGGFSSLTDFYDEVDRVEIADENMIISFLKNGGRLPNVKNDYFIKIETKHLFIENDSVINNEFYWGMLNRFKISPGYIFQLCDFKAKTSFYQPENFVKMFAYAVEHGLENIFAETTAKDMDQIEQLQKVIELVMSKNPEKTLNIYLKVFGDKEFKTELNNINIVKL